MKNMMFLLVVTGSLIVAGVSAVRADNHEPRSLSLAEAIASGECDDGDTPCLEALMQQADDASSDDASSKDDDSKSDDASSDDASSKDDDSKSDDASSDDASSKDDDSKSDDASSDDASSKDDDNKSDDASSDDASSKDDDSKSDDASSDDDSSRDDDSKSDDASSDEDSSSDDDKPLPTISIGDGQGEEFNNITLVPVALQLELSAPSAQAVTVQWMTEDGTAVAGSDYVAASGEVTFAPGDQIASITVFLVGEDISEPTESFFVRLSMPSGATLLDDLGEVVIIDDDDIDE